MRSRWENAYDIRPSKNIRGENVYDIYRKDTEDMIWADIPVSNIDRFLKDMVSISDRVIQEELDNIFSEATEENKDEATDGSQ